MLGTTFFPNMEFVWEQSKKYNISLEKKINEKVF